jgi:hypothetical protein
MTPTISLPSFPLIFDNDLEQNSMVRYFGLMIFWEYWITQLKVISEDSFGNGPTCCLLTIKVGIIEGMTV